MTDRKVDLKRDNTMQITTKEGERYLQEVWNVPVPSKGEDSNESSKPKLSKHTTMLQTKKEGESYIAAKGGLDEDVKTRNQQDQIDKLLEEPMAKKQKVFNEKDDDDEEEDDKQKPSMKRISTTLRTAKEGEELLKELGHKDDQPESDRRRTRSQTRGVPIPPPTPKRERKPVKEYSKNDLAPKSRGRGRPRKEVKRDEEKSDNSVEDNVVEDQNMNKESSKEGDDNEACENENGDKEVEEDTEEESSKVATSVTTAAGEGVTESKN